MTENSKAPANQNFDIGATVVAPRMTLNGLKYIVDLLATRPIAEAGPLHSSLDQQGGTFLQQAQAMASAAQQGTPQAKPSGGEPTVMTAPNKIRGRGKK